MGALSGFIAREFQSAGRDRENEKAGAAIPAIPAIRQPENSKNSENSRGAVPYSAHRCGCGGVGIHGAGWFLRQPDRATWYCSECFKAVRAAGQA